MASLDHDEMCAAPNKGALIIFTAILPLPSSSHNHTHQTTTLALEEDRPLPLPLPAAPNLPYACNICPASFAKPQSLGGHKTKHRTKSTAPGGTSDQFHSHKCSDCSRRFPTGQALGGHKRKHFLEKINRGKKTSPSGSPGFSFYGSSSVSVENGAGRLQGHARTKPLDFDLNEPYTQ